MKTEITDIIMTANRNISGANPRRNSAKTDLRKSVHNNALPAPYRRNAICQKAPSGDKIPKGCKNHPSTGKNQIGFHQPRLD